MLPNGTATVEVDSERVGYEWELMDQLPFTLTNNPTGYVITANPHSFGNSGSRAFYPDQTMVVRENHTPEPATANSPQASRS